MGSCKKSSKRILGLSLVAAAAAAWAVAAHAREVPVDVQTCWGGTSQVTVPAQGMVMGTFQLSGTQRSAQAGGAWDGSSIECLGTFEVFGGRYHHTGYCTSVDRDGDKAWGRDIRNKDEDILEYVGGTGKYAGISGKLRKERPAPFPALRAGLLQGCARVFGAYTLP
jgi:opacity protein-like surface antigen